MLARSLRALSGGSRLRSATLPCIRTGHLALCAVRMCANVSEPKPEPEGMQRLADTIGDRNAKRLLQTHGVTSRLADGSLLTGIQTLREEFGISGDGLVTFMSNSVAARLENEAFWAGLRRLDQEFGVSGDGLITFMSNSVAARLEGKAFWVGLRRLGDFGIVGPRLVTFMSGSVAARLSDEAFWVGLRRLRELGIVGEGLVTFMSESVAVRLEDEAFWAGLTRLRELGITGDKLATFMNGSVATRLENDDFMDGLSSLCSELSPFVVVGLLKNNDSFSSRLTVAYARSVLSITRHLDAHGFEGAKRLKALVGKSPLVGKVPELEAILLAEQRKDKIEAVLQRFRGSYAEKRAIAATL